MPNLGQQKLRLWASGKSLRGAAKELGVDYHTYVRWHEGTMPRWEGLRICRQVIGIDYADWDMPESARLEREIVRAQKAAIAK